MGVKMRVGGVWVPLAVPAKKTGSIESVSDSVLLDLNGGVISDVTVSESPNTAPQSATATPTLFLIPPPVLLSGNNITSGSTVTTRPVGTASGDKLYLAVVYPNTQVAAQVITGWTIESGIDSLPATHKSTIYSRTADLTATDTPTLTTTPTNGAWMMIAVKTTTGVDVAVAKTTGTLAIIPTPAITTSAAKTIIITIIMTGTNVSVTAVTGPLAMSWIDDAAAVTILMTRVVETAGLYPAGTGTVTISSSSPYIAYSVALTY